MRIMNEATMFKFIWESRGLIFSVTARRRAYFFFLTGSRIGVRVAPITDPYPGIVEICGYDVEMIAHSWDKLFRVRLAQAENPNSGQRPA